MAKNTKSLSPGISDHDLVFIVRKQAKIRKAKVTITIRCYRHFNPVKFAHHVKNTNWLPVTTATNIDIAACNFNRIFEELIDAHMPWKKIRARANSARWMSNEYLSLADAREYHAREYSLCPCEYHLTKKLDSKRQKSKMD